MAKDETSLAFIRSKQGQVKPLPDGGWEVGFQFRGQELTDEDLETVVEVKNIVSLNLRDTQITSAGMRHLKNLHNLEHLHLERTMVDDSGLQHLQNLTKLNYLNLYGTQVSDSGIQHLSGLKNLRHLFVWQTKVTPNEARKLQAALPKLKISLGVDLSTIEIMEEKEEPEVLEELEWLPEDGDKQPPKRSIAGVGMRILFLNQRKETVQLYWVDYGGGLKLYGEIEPGAQREQNSFSKAVWLLTDLQENRLGYFVTTDKNSTATIPEE